MAVIAEDEVNNEMKSSVSEKVILWLAEDGVMVFAVTVGVVRAALSRSTTDSAGMTVVSSILSESETSCRAVKSGSVASSVAAETSTPPASKVSSCSSSDMVSFAV